jgi:hypothetical protein
MTSSSVDPTLISKMTSVLSGSVEKAQQAIDSATADIKHKKLQEVTKDVENKGNSIAECQPTVN